MKKNKKGQVISTIDEEAFNKKVDESNCLIIIHPERLNSPHATIHAKFDFDIEDSVANDIVPQIADRLLMSEVAKLIRNEYIIEVYGVVSYSDDNTKQIEYNAICSRPVVHGLPTTLTEDGWAKEIDAFAERMLSEYKVAF